VIEIKSSSGGSIEGVSHFGIQVADLARSIAFYRDLLGLELIAEWVRDQPYIQELVGYPGVELNVAVFRLPGSTSFLEILEYRNVERHAVDPGTANPGTAHLCVYVDDLQALHERLAAGGARFVSPIKSPTAGPNTGGKVIYMIDPDGIRVELLETALTLAGERRDRSGSGNGDEEAQK
jgi:lactoylglutathione lyase